jgi:uncharacterized protein YdeI (YjbR/CyaY-like superfamily)
MELMRLEVRNRQQWRSWLGKHHASSPGVWLVFYKNHAGVQSLSYEDSICKALCFGWVDSLVKRLDDDRYARKFTPRQPASKWSTINRRRYADLKARRLLAAPGLERAPTSRSGDAPRPSLSVIPSYIEKRLRADARAWSYFEQLAQSYQRAYVGWVDSAKREETKERRLREVIRLLAAGRKLGLK